MSKSIVGFRRLWFVGDGEEVFKLNLIALLVTEIKHSPNTPSVTLKIIHAVTSIEEYYTSIKNSVT